jgi:hypothetical protein
MSSAEEIGDTRLLLGLAIAPAVFPIYLFLVYHFDFYTAGGLDLELHVAIAAGIAYIGAGLPGLPYVFFMRNVGRLNYWAIMGPTLVLTATVLILEQALGLATPDGGIGVMSKAPGVLLGGICFYLLAVWRYGRDAKWPLLLSMALIWLLHVVCITIERHHFLASNPISDTAAASGLMIVIRGGRILSLGATGLLACVWLVSVLWRPSATGSSTARRSPG